MWPQSDNIVRGMVLLRVSRVISEAFKVGKMGAVVSSWSNEILSVIIKFASAIFIKSDLTFLLLCIIQIYHS